jgi:hypothetical protein
MPLIEEVSTVTVYSESALDGVTRKIEQNKIRTATPLI